MGPGAPPIQKRPGPPGHCPRLLTISAARPSALPGRPPLLLQKCVCPLSLGNFAALPCGHRRAEPPGRREPRTPSRSGSRSRRAHSSPGCPWPPRPHPGGKQNQKQKEHPRRCTYLKTRAPCHDKGTLGLSGGVEQRRCECNFPAASTPGFAASRARPLGGRDKAAGSSRVPRADPRGAPRRLAAAAARGAVAGPAGARLVEPSAQAEGRGAEGRGAGSRRRGGAAAGLAASCEQGGGWGRQLLDSHFSLTPGGCALLSASS